MSNFGSVLKEFLVGSSLVEVVAGLVGFCFGLTLNEW